MKLIILFLQTILSLSTSNDELLQKLKVYQLSTGISEELMMKYFAEVGAIIYKLSK